MLLNFDKLPQCEVMLAFNKNTPVLFIAFNRPDVTLQVFEAIRKAQPYKLYFAVDGPRKEEEQAVCEQVRAIAHNVDWNCEVHTLFRDSNLGCRSAVSSAITWFFDHEPEGIILEDDCLPSENFFGFCSTLLEKYRDDSRIGHISGDNFQFGNTRGDGSYYFSRLTHVWGWASWRRVWQNYDLEISSFPSFKLNGQLDNIPSHAPFKENWLKSFEVTYTGELNSWDYQYAYLNLINNQLSIMPNVNLVSNIGFGEKATHTVTESKLANIPVGILNKIVHPQFMLAELSADLFTQQIEGKGSKSKSTLSKLWRGMKNI